MLAMLKLGSDNAIINNSGNSKIIHSDKSKINRSDKAKKIHLLRICYLIGAFLDALFAIDMYYVSINGSESTLSTIFSLEIEVTDAYRYALALFGAAVTSWTILLLWANQKPVERKGILLITITIFIGLLVANLIGERLNVLPTEKFIRRLIAYLSLIGLYAYSYWNARDLQTITD